VISIRGHRHVFADAFGARPLIKSGIDIRVRGAIGPREANDNVVLGEIEGPEGDIAARFFAKYSIIEHE
jgi:hypothetical protein